MSAHKKAYLICENNCKVHGFSQEQTIEEIEKRLGGRNLRYKFEGTTLDIEVEETNSLNLTISGRTEQSDVPVPESWQPFQVVGTDEEIVIRNKADEGNFCLLKYVIDAPLYEGDSIDPFGVLRRNMAVIVCDGVTETWGRVTGSTFIPTLPSMTLPGIKDHVDPTVMHKCRSTHFQSHMEGDGLTGIVQMRKSIHFNLPEGFPANTLQTWEAWVAEQYENGTPLTIVYPLEHTVEKQLNSLGEIYLKPGANHIYSECEGLEPQLTGDYVIFSLAESGGSSGDLSNYYTKTQSDNKYQPKGSYLTSVPSEYVTETELTAKKYLTSYTETDPTVPSWAKQSKKPSYSASEVGADAAGTASSAVTAHNSSASAHADIRSEVDSLKESIADYLPKNQGSQNAGKMLVVGTDGNITLMNVPEGGASGDVTGVLDESNNILLSGNLADGTYTLKYLNADGTYTDIGNLVVNAIPDEPKEPTNLFVIGGEGFILNGRCSSAGADRTGNTGYIVTNYIDIKNGDTVYIKNASISTVTNAYSGIKLTDGTTIGLYPNSSEYITNYSESNGITQFTINKADADYIRITLVIYTDGRTATEERVSEMGIIITVNEPLS